MIIGYLRVSTEKQHPANQQDEIRRFAESNNSSSIIGSQKLPAAKRANATANWAYCYADLNETTH